jgi:hypothetical protein
MQRESTTITALDAVRSGRCSGICLVANPATTSSCDCSCDGEFHGALADAELVTRPAPIDPALCGAKAPEDRFGYFTDRDVFCEQPAGHLPVPAQFQHHNGGYGMWFEDYDQCQCPSRYSA